MKMRFDPLKNPTIDPATGAWLPMDEYVKSETGDGIVLMLADDGFLTAGYYSKGNQWLSGPGREISPVCFARIQRPTANRIRTDQEKPTMTDKPTICIECKHMIAIMCGIDQCRINPRIDYVHGGENLWACCVKNDQGKCPDFKAKEAPHD